MLPIIIILTVNIVILVLMFLYFRRRINKQLDPERFLSGLEEEVEGLVRELNTTTERNLLLLEGKITELKELLRVSEKRGELLQRESEKNRKSRLTYEHLKKSTERIKPNPPPKPSVEKGPDKVDTTTAVLEFYRQGVGVHQIAERLSIPYGEVELIISLHGDRSGK